MKKFSTSEKMVYTSIAMLTVAVLAIVGWEQVRQPLLDKWNGETYTMEQIKKTPTTIDGLIEEQALDWLESPEALEYAKEKVTEKVVEDLSKL